MLHILEDSTVNAISENKGTLYSFKRSCHLQAMICLLVLIYIKSNQLRYMYLFLFSILLQTKLLSMVVIFSAQCWNNCYSVCKAVSAILILTILSYFNFLFYKRDPFSIVFSYVCWYLLSNTQHPLRGNIKIIYRWILKTKRNRSKTKV